MRVTETLKEEAFSQNGLPRIWTLTYYIHPNHWLFAFAIEAQNALILKELGKDVFIELLENWNS